MSIRYWRSREGTVFGYLYSGFYQIFFVIDNKTGCRFITVDAYVEALPFYLKNNFLPLGADMDSDYTKLLFFDLDEIEEWKIFLWQIEHFGVGRCYNIKETEIALCFFMVLD